MKRIQDVQWVITERCNLSASHCGIVPKGKELLEEGTDQIFKILECLKSLKMEVKILGGNFSDHFLFPEIVAHMNQLGMVYAITDNGINQDTIIQTIEKQKINGLVFSIDTLRSLDEYRNISGFDLGGCSLLKSAAALSLIPKIREKVSYIGINCVIHSGNLDQIVPIVKYCTEELENVFVNLCPLIHGDLVDKNGKNLFIYRPSTETVNQYVLRPEHQPRLTQLVKELIELKESDYKIGVPVEYLEMIGNCLTEMNNCCCFETCPILRIFPDGKLGVCSDLRGKEIRRFTIFDFAKNPEEVIRTWLNDSQHKLCCKESGCMWSNIYIANIYKKKGRGTISATAKNL